MDKSPDAFRTISEVADLLDTPAHVLRFWESRFPQIRPVKRAGGRRYYRPADVALLGGIRQLLHEQGLTIRGVQKILREQGIRHVAGLVHEGAAAMEALGADEEAALEAALNGPLPGAAPDEADILPDPAPESAEPETAEIVDISALRRADGVRAAPPEQGNLFADLFDLMAPPMPAEPAPTAPGAVEGPPSGPVAEVIPLSAHLPEPAPPAEPEPRPETPPETRPETRTETRPEPRIAPEPPGIFADVSDIMAFVEAETAAMEAVEFDAEEGPEDAPEAPFVAVDDLDDLGEAAAPLPFDSQTFSAPPEDAARPLTELARLAARLAARRPAALAGHLPRLRALRDRLVALEDRLTAPPY